MGKLYELKQQLKSVTAQASAIAELAKSEDREFSSAEQREVDAHLEAAKGLRREIERLSEDPHQVAGLKRDHNLVSLEEVAKLDRMFAGENNSNGAKWSDSFMKALPYQPASGRKDLLPTSGSVTVGTMSDQIGELADRAETIIQFMQVEPHSGDAFAYLRETYRQHGAKPVETGGLKPTSVYELERVDDRIRTIAHLSEPISRNWLSDAPMLKRYLNGVLREGLQLELEQQILQGDGTGENMTGMLTTAGVQVIVFSADVIETARRAITALEVLPVAPTGWAIHPEDWETMELTTASGGEYLLKDGSTTLPIDRAKRQLWGLPVALTLGLDEGTAVLADWETAVTLFEREGTRIDWSEAFNVPAGAYDAKDTSGFERNLVKFRAEGRWGLAVNRPAAICEVRLEAGS